MSDMENRENVNHYLTDFEKNDSDIVVIGSNIPQELVLASGKIPYWILGGSGWRRLQPFQYGKPCFAAGWGNRCAFKESRLSIPIERSVFVILSMSFNKSNTF